MSEIRATHLCPRLLLTFINIMIQFFTHFYLHVFTLPNCGIAVHVIKSGLNFIDWVLSLYIQHPELLNSTLAASSVLGNDASSLVEMASPWGPNKASRP